MSLHPQEIAPVPKETCLVARAVIPGGIVYIRLREELRAIYDGQSEICAVSLRFEVAFRLRPLSADGLTLAFCAMACPCHLLHSERRAAHPPG